MSFENCGEAVTAGLPPLYPVFCSQKILKDYELTDQKWGILFRRCQISRFNLDVDHKDMSNLKKYAR